MQSFGEKLADILHSRKISQTKFAEDIGITRPALGHNLKGRIPQSDTLIKMAYALQMTVDDLIFGTDLSVTNTISNNYPSLADNITDHTKTENQNENIMHEPQVSYHHSPSVLEKLSVALMNFSENDKIRAENEQKLIETNLMNMKMQKEILDLLTEMKKK